MNETDPDLVTLASRTVYQNRWMRVHEDRIRRRDGSEGIYGVIDKADFVVVAPIQDGVVHLVQQYRYPIKLRQWEFPQGSWQDRPDAAPEQVARGELEEETGLIAEEIAEVGRLYPLYGAVTHCFRIFFAPRLRPGQRKLDMEEQDLITAAFPLATVEAMILDGTIRDAVTVSAFGLLRLRRLI